VSVWEEMPATHVPASNGRGRVEALRSYRA
jgi:hypothetical protein